MSPESVIKAFNAQARFVVAKNAKHLFPGFDEKTQKHAAELLALVTKKKYKLEHYICACFAKHSWAHIPKIAKLTEDEYTQFYEENEQYVLAWWLNIKRELEASQPHSFSMGKEIIKKRLLASGGPLFCHAQQMLTGGFNPLSDLCAQCAVKDRCGD